MKMYDTGHKKRVNSKFETLINFPIISLNVLGNFCFSIGNAGVILLHFKMELLFVSLFQNYYFLGKCNIILGGLV
jgi:hypothetical protein